MGVPGLATGSSARSARARHTPETRESLRQRHSSAACHVTTLIPFHLTTSCISYRHPQILTGSEIVDAVRVMYCQKCRTPLALHASLDNLNPASFHLLADAPALPDLPTSQEDNSSATRASKGSQVQQRQLYAKASARARSPVFRRSDATPSARQDDGASSPPSPTAERDRTGMSFVNITDSQVVPPSVALRANNPQNGSPRRRHDPHQRRPRRTSARKSKSGSTTGGDSDGDSSSSSEDGRLSRRMATSTRLFDILSSRTDIDHPICGECADALIAQLERRLASAARERDAYIDFLRELRASAPGADDAAAASAELAASRTREASALSELETLEKQRAALAAEAAELEAESAALDADEASFWRARNAFAGTARAHAAAKAAADARFAHDTRLLEALRRTDVYTDAFAISYDGSFGTINGLRLGRLPKGPEVEWAEVNAAWGMAALLLDTLAEKLRFGFRGFKVHPLGSASKVERLPARRVVSGKASAVSTDGRRDGGEGRANTPESRQRGTPAAAEEDRDGAPAAVHADDGKPGEMLPLHRSDTPLNLAWMHKGFDAAMVAFLECMRQLGRHVEERAASRPAPPASSSAKTSSQTASVVKMPYVISRDKINECSIKSNGFAADETWTRACKHTLTYCKFLMAYTRDVRIEDDGGDDGDDRTGEGALA